MSHGKGVPRNKECKGTQLRGCKGADQAKGLEHLGLELDQLTQPRRVELHLGDALAVAQRQVVLLLPQVAYGRGERPLEALDLVRVRVQIRVGVGGR